MRQTVPVPLTIVALCATLLMLPAAGQTKPDKNKGLIIYGEGFCFTVLEPQGWHVDIEEIAQKNGVNAIFLPESEESKKSDVTIRIRVNNKVDEDIQTDLSADMDGYKEKYSDVRFEDLSVPHTEYRMVAKLFWAPESFYEYVVYLNPGKDVPLVFSFAMSKEGKRASVAELAAFAKVLESFQFLTQYSK
jgi:hypothetical protein